MVAINSDTVDGIIIGILVTVILTVVALVMHGGILAYAASGDEFTIGADQLARVSVEEQVVMFANGKSRYTDNIDADCLDQQLPKNLDVAENLQDGQRTAYIENRYGRQVSFARWRLTDCVEKAVDPYAPWMVNHPEITVYSMSYSEVMD